MTRLELLATALLAAGGVGFLPGGEPKGVDREELKKFQGRWALVCAVIDGRALGEAELGKTTLTFEGVRMTTALEGKEKGRAAVSLLDPGKAPAQIDLTNEDGPARGKTARGVYEFGAGTLTIRHGHYGAGRPAGPAGKAGPEDVQLVLKRVR